MAKRLRFIPKGLPPQTAWSAGHGVLIAFTVTHPGTGRAHGVRIEEHESGDLVIIGPQYVFRVVSRLLGDGDIPNKERVARFIEASWTLQDQLNREFFAPEP